jgi:hypothetical protein
MTFNFDVFGGKLTISLVYDKTNTLEGSRAALIKKNCEDTFKNEGCCK